MNQQVRMLSTPEAAAFCGVSASYLNKLRCRGAGPRFIKHGRNRVVYDPADLTTWGEGLKRNSTSETGGRA